MKGFEKKKKFNQKSYAYNFFFIMKLCEYSNIFHELLETIDSHFSKIFTFYYYYETNTNGTLTYYLEI